MFDYGQGTRAPGDHLDLPTRTTLFDLTLVLEEAGEELVGALESATDLFEADTARRLIRSLTTVLAALAADPDRRLSRLPLLDGDHRRRIVSTWNATEQPLPAATTVPELIAEHTARDRSAVAAVQGELSLTYGELDDRARRLAGRLRELGAGPEAVVGLHLDRGLDLVVAVLAVWQAGAAYLPLDPDYPADRLAYELADSGAGLVVTESRIQRLPWSGPLLDIDAEDLLDRPSDPPFERGRLASVIYTSGSTGQPKGVMIEHASLLAVYGAWAAAFLDGGAAYRWLCLASASFDVFTGDLVRALCAGGTLVLAAPGLRASIPELTETIVRHEVNALELAPRFVDELVEHLEQTGRTPASLRLLVVTTDTWRTGRAARAREVLGPQVRLRTAFGITETTIDSTSSDLSTARTGTDTAVPIGRPLANTRVYVLDRYLTPVPVGVPGELFIAGAGLARGYAGRPDLTAERFLADPFDPDGRRLYRSGDRARWRPDGELEFLGRLDDQAKIRGFRIEPGEVEAALQAHSAVRAAAVAARAVNGDIRLVGYVVPGTDEVLATTDLRAFLRRRLPEHLVPGTMVELPGLPMTPNGKLDRAALPDPDGARPELGDAFVAPRTPTEEAIARIWVQVLGVEQVGVRDDFFDLGGHSLLATRVVARLRSAFGVALGLAAIFDHPTVAALGEAIEPLLLEEIEQMSEDEAARALGLLGPAADPDEDGAVR
jgi:amino acid adenylation domain-containing protein